MWGRAKYAAPVSTNPKPAEGARWATFDCYGTLVDWRAGIRAELEQTPEIGELLAFIASSQRGFVK